MAFRFIHTSDWQIGRPFARFPEDVRGVLREARLAVVGTIAEAARQSGAGHVLVAGDLYDSESLTDTELRPPLGAMARATDVVWHVIAGNHDPARRGGIWSKVQALGLPENVLLHDDAHPVEIGSGVWLLPASLKSKATATDPTEWMDQATTPEGALRIGLAHGSVQSFGSDGESAVAINPARVKSAGLDYLALGDWHGKKEINARCWYSGTPEADRFPNNEPGYVLDVALAPGGDVTVMPIATGCYQWGQREENITSVNDLDRLKQWVGAAAGDPRRMLLKLQLRGLVSLGEHGRCLAALERIGADLLHLEVDTEDLMASPSDAELEALETGSELGLAAQFLREQIEVGAGEDSDARSDLNGAGEARGPDTARRALALLYALAQEADAR